MKLDMDRCHMVGLNCDLNYLRSNTPSRPDRWRHGQLTLSLSSKRSPGGNATELE